MSNRMTCEAINNPSGLTMRRKRSVSKFLSRYAAGGEISPGPFPVVTNDAEEGV